MSRSGISQANANKRVRQEALREQLSAQGHVQHVIDISNKLSDLNEELDSTEVQRLKSAADIKCKLITKYLPDLKSVEVEADVAIRPRVVDLSSGKMDRDAKPDSKV